MDFLPASKLRVELLDSTDGVTPANNQSSIAERVPLTDKSVVSSVTHDRPAADPIPEGFMSVLTPVPLLPLGASYLKKKFIVNELLCYLQNKIDSVPFATLAKLASDFYPVDRIKEAKKLLYSLVKVEGSRYRQCIGNNKKKEDICDMLRLMLSAELSHLPMFLAFDLSQLPPMSGDTQDMSSILRNIESIQSTVDLLSSTQKQLSDHVYSQASKPLPGEVTLNTIEVPPANDVTSVHSDGVPSIQRPADNVHSDSYHSEESTTVEGTLMDDWPPVANSVPSRVFVNSNLKPSYAKKVKAPSNTRQTSGAGRGGMTIGRGHTNELQVAHHSGSGGNSQSMNFNSHNSNQIMIGRGTAPGLLAARRHGRKDAAPMHNRMCTGIFLTNLHPRTTAKQVAFYVKKELARDVNVEKLPTKYDSYCSFHIRCDHQARNVLMDPDIWPADCKVKLFYTS